ncbi:MAG: endonuclease domain-containing protein [Flavobacteriales bacterium]
MKHIPYNTDLKTFSRNLRSNQTLGETLLWMELQKRQVFGYQFNRQKPLGDYIVDFYCRQLQLVIEIDGGSHHFEEIVVKDVERQRILEDLGMHFLRLSEMDVRKKMDEVLMKIEGTIKNLESENV